MFQLERENSYLLQYSEALATNLTCFKYLLSESSTTIWLWSPFRFGPYFVWRVVQRMALARRLHFSVLINFKVLESLSTTTFENRKQRGNLTTLKTFSNFLRPGRQFYTCDKFPEQNWVNSCTVHLIWGGRVKLKSILITLFEYLLYSMKEVQRVKKGCRFLASPERRIHKLN